MKNRFLLLLICALPVAAAETAVELDPARTVVTFTLHDVLHTVHGSFKLKRGSMTFDPATGKAAGEMVVDVTSGASGGDTRDRRMHKEILESARYPAAKKIELMIVMPNGADQSKRTDARNLAFNLLAETSIGPTGSLANAGLLPLPPPERISARSQAVAFMDQR